MNIMMGMVREDILTTYFGSTWSRAIKKTDTSTEKAAASINSSINFKIWSISNPQI